MWQRLKAGLVRVAEGTELRYSPTEGHVNLVLLVAWSDKTKGERLGNLDQHTALTDLHVYKPTNATKPLKTELSVLHQVPTLDCGATAAGPKARDTHDAAKCHSIFPAKTGTASLLSLWLLKENKNTGLYQIKLNKAGYFQEQRKLNSPDCTVEVTHNVPWPKLV